MQQLCTIYDYMRSYLLPDLSNMEEAGRILIHKGMIGEQKANLLEFCCHGPATGVRKA